MRRGEPEFVALAAFVAKAAAASPPHLVRSFAADHPWERVFNEAVGRKGLRWSLETRANGGAHGVTWRVIQGQASSPMQRNADGPGWGGSSWVRLTVVAESECVHENVSWCNVRHFAAWQGHLQSVSNL